MSDSDDATGYATIPRWLQRDPDVSIYAKAVYVALNSRTNARGIAYPKHETIAAECGCSERKVRDAIAELRRIGVLTTERRYGKNGQTSNAYRLAVHRPEVTAHGAATDDEVTAHGAATARHRVPTNELPKNDLPTSARDDDRHVEAADAALMPAAEDVVIDAWTRALAAVGSGTPRVDARVRAGVRAWLRSGIEPERVAQVVGWAFDESNPDPWWRGHLTTLGKLREQWARLQVRVPLDWRDPALVAVDVAAQRERDERRLAALTAERAEWARTAVPMPAYVLDRSAPVPAGDLFDPWG